MPCSFEILVLRLGVMSQFLSSDRCCLRSIGYAIQVLRNAVGGGRVSDFLEKSTKVYGLALLALQGGGWV